MKQISMTVLKSLSTAAAVIGGLAISAEAQPPPTYLAPNSDSKIDALVGKVLGEDYSETERVAVHLCARAAMQQAYVQYWPRSDSYIVRSDPQLHPLGHGINPVAQMRVTAISEVQRRRDGVHVSGLIDARAGYPLYGPVYGNLVNVYGAADGLSFSCNVDFSGIVSNLRVLRANTYRR